MQLPERRAYRLLLAFLAGAGGVLCFEPFGAFWLAPLVWLLFFVLLRDAESGREGALTGWLFGAGFFLAGVSWVYVSLSVFGGMPWWLAGPATVLFCCALALLPAVAAAVFKQGQPGSTVWQALWFAGLFAMVDWLRGWIFTGFPWLTVGYTQTSPSPLAGFAPLIGVYGLSWLLLLLAALLARWRTGLLILTASLALGFGLRQIDWTQPEGEPLRVALIQGNIPQDMKFRPERFFQTLQTYRDLIAAHPAQLTLLPETALPTFIDQLPPDYLAELTALAARSDGDLLLGTLTGNRERYLNSAVSLGRSPQQVYSKQHLVPFGEWIPPGFTWFMAYANIPMSSFSAGPAIQPPLTIAGRKVAVNICYEDVFGEEIINALPQAGILANLSNTAWFGRSLAQPQHLQIARMRAAETGRPMLRATNTGMTAIIDARGDLQALASAFETTVLTGEVRAHIGSTPYSRLGNWPALLLIALSLAGALTHRRR